MSDTSPSDACLAKHGLRPSATIYSNPLAAPSDIEGWRLEGPATTTFPLGRLRLESTGATSAGQKSNLVFWCPEVFPDRIRVSWDFYPVREPGLAIVFFAAKGQNGEHLFDESLAARNGPYNQYHSGDINALHASYFRRKQEGEIRFQTCNLRKSRGFHLVCQGGDPIPSVAQADPPYRIALIKHGPEVIFCIDDLEVFHWTDPGDEFGPILGDGQIGFRQMNPLIGEYADLMVESLEAS